MEVAVEGIVGVLEVMK
jgi:hypothetical protein